MQNLPDTRSRLQNTLEKVYQWVEINPDIIGICLGYRLKNMYQGSGYSGGGSQNLIAKVQEGTDVKGKTKSVEAFLKQAANGFSAVLEYKPPEGYETL